MQTHTPTADAPTGTFVAPHSVTSQQHIAYTTADLPTLAPSQLHMADLIQQCRVENERCGCGQPQDTRYAYEMFRRALDQGDEHAWTYVRMEYEDLVELWVQRCGGVGGVTRRAWLVAAAFARFRQVVTHFYSFPTLTSLLHHLQFCAAYVVVDAARTMPASYFEGPPAPAEGELARAVGGSLA